MTPYNFLIAAKTPEGRYLPSFGCACSPVKQSGIAELQAGTSDVRGKKFVGKVQPTVRFVLRFLRLFLAISVSQTEIVYNLPCLSNFDGFFFP